ncbi:hypothetical protein D3C87_1938410 [compost metagenome]
MQKSGGELRYSVPLLARNNKDKLLIQNRHHIKRTTACRKGHKSDIKTVFLDGSDNIKRVPCRHTDAQQRMILS